ncbi:unnamed protein product [Mytilus edulis]|uniref:Uncharacterized protein n=1 Tax=Mytilus edulis TaxID=6550 RepID=A0A8S3T3Q6_MYTED|nr:unnamed protein product [Mytilus edulis]
MGVNLHESDLYDLKAYTDASEIGFGGFVVPAIDSNSAESVCDSSDVQMNSSLITPRNSLHTPLRYKIYKEGNQEICNACSQEVETVEHLLIKCKAWDNIRRPVIKEIENILTSNSKIEWESLNEGTKIQILMDITMVQRQLRLNSEEVSKIEHQAKRLIFLIHSARCKLLLQP